MQFLYYALFAAGIVAVDQLSKYFTVAYIPLYTDISFIPGVLNLTYVQNSGAAFSSFEGQQWLFALIFLFFTGLIVWEYFKKKMAFTPFERWCIAAIYGGGLANMVDRLRMGYVVDMIETEKYGIYHVTNEGGYISWYDFACEIFRQAGLPVTVQPVTTAEYGLSTAARPFNSRLDKAKLVENGFVPLPDWRDALKRYLKEMRAD